jgi:ABC-type nitrate/sulfonate/bicarbonate transport system permease component
MSQPDLRPGKVAAAQEGGPEALAVPAPRSRPPQSGRPRWSVPSAVQRIWPPLLLVVLVIAIWDVGVRVEHVSPEVLPTPFEVVRSGWADRTNLWAATRVTLVEAVLGVLLALVVALAIGFLIDFFVAVRRSIYPLLIGSQALPIVAIAPLVIIWFGFGLTPKVLLVGLYTFFPIVVSFVEGLASTQEESMDLMRTMGAGRLSIFFRVRFPSSVPQLFTGLRIAVTYAVVAGVIAEFVGAAQGLGVYIDSAKNAFRTDLVLAATLVVVAITLAMFGCLLVLQRVLVPWYRPQRRGKRW